MASHRAAASALACPSIGACHPLPLMAAPLASCRKRLASRRHRMSHTAAATVQTHPPKSQTPPPPVAKLPQSATAPTVNTNANQRVVTVETPRPLAMEGHYP